MTDRTIRERKRRLVESNTRKGLVQVQVWIPEGQRVDLHDLAAKWRKVWADALAAKEKA